MSIKFEKSSQSSKSSVVLPSSGATAKWTPPKEGTGTCAVVSRPEGGTGGWRGANMGANMGGRPRGVACRVREPNARFRCMARRKHQGAKTCIVGSLYARGKIRIYICEKKRWKNGKTPQSGTYRGGRTWDGKAWGGAGCLRATSLLVVLIS